MKIFLGDKFYQYNKEEDNVTVIRVTRMKNPEVFGFTTEDTNAKGVISKRELDDKWIRLKPDADIAFTIVDLEMGLKDVIVAVYKRDELEDGNTVPYVVCRQNVLDIFSNQVIKNEEITYIGVSVSRDTIPADVPFEMMLACNGISHVTKVSAYMDDTLDIILSMIKESKFDEVLNGLYNKVDHLKTKGYCKSLRQLLTENNFMYDFLRAFDIYQVDFKVETVNDVLVHHQQMIMEDLLKVTMLGNIVMSYDKEINLKKIKREYVLVSDLDNKLSLIAFDKGEYINRAYRDNIRDKRDAVAMLKNKKINK